MITPSFSLTATERVLPKLALDFTTASLDARVTFTRTTGASNPATYVNSSGVITSATNNQPRFDFDPVALTCKGLLIEESRANLALYSQDFTNAAWTGGTLTNMTLGASGETSPDGTANAGVLTATDASCSYLAANNNATTIVGTQTMSMYVKSTNRQWWRARVYRTSANAATCWFDLQNGAVGSNASVGSLTFSSASIAAAGNGWYRVTITVSSSAAGTNANFWVAPATSNGGTTGGAIGDAISVWGNQYETGAFATSYIPTTTTALTRNADVASMTGTNFSDWWNNSEGSLNMQYARIANGVSGKFPYAGYIYTDVNNRFEIYQNSNTAETVAGRASGATSFGFNFTIATANQLVNAVMAYKQNNFASCINAAATQTDASGNVPTVNTFYIGGVNSTGFEVNGWMKKINYWPQRLTNAEVQAFSK